MKKIFLLLVIALFLNACIVDDSVDPVGIDVITIARGALGTNAEEPILKGPYLVNSSGEWTEIRAKMSKFGTVNYSETDIDFEVFQVVAFIDTIQTPANLYYGLHIFGATEFNGRRFIGAQRDTLDTRFNTFEQPFHIVKLPKTALPYDFSEN